MLTHVNAPFSSSREEMLRNLHKLAVKKYLILWFWCFFLHSEMHVV